MHVFQGYCFFLAAFVYPVIVSWAWNTGGWLNRAGYHDLAGTSVIHITGGFGGMIGALLVGPRLVASDRVKTIDREKLLKERDYLAVLKTIDNEEDKVTFRKWFLLQLDEKVGPSN